MPDKNIIDLTPKQQPNISRILFVPDPNMNYQGRQIYSVRLNILGNAMKAMKNLSALLLQMISCATVKAITG